MTISFHLWQNDRDINPGFFEPDQQEDAVLLLLEIHLAIIILEQKTAYESYFDHVISVASFLLRSEYEQY